MYPSPRWTVRRTKGRWGHGRWPKIAPEVRVPLEIVGERRGLPAVGMHCAGLDAIFNERMQAGGGGVLDYPHANSTDTLSVRLIRYRNQSLA